MDGGTQRNTLLDDYDRFFLLMEGLVSTNRADSAIVQIEKDGRNFLLCNVDNHAAFLFQMGVLEPLELFGIDEEFLRPEEFKDPTILEEEGYSMYMIRCVQIDLGDGALLNIWLMLDMTDEIQEHRLFIRRNVLFIIVLTMLSAVIGILLMRHYVTLPIQRLARATEMFTPEEDGSYSREKILQDEIRSRDEIGDLSLEIRAMQEGIVDNTQKLALMTAEKERVKTEMDMAAGIQANALPSVFPAFPDRSDFTVYATMNPAKEVGGDFYDFFLIDDTHLGIVMADVSDKGVPAALFMMTAKTLVQIYAKMRLSPAETLRKTNEWLSTNNKAAMFVTVWFGILDLTTGVITAVNAGHEYPVLSTGGQLFQVLRDKHGFVVGVSQKAKFTEYEIRMVPGDKLLLYTDGVPEAQTDDKKMFGMERMVAALNEDPDASPEQLLLHVLHAVEDFIDGAKQFDDLTMLCLEYRGYTDDADREEGDES